MAKASKKQVDAEHKEWQRRYLIKAKFCALSIATEIDGVIRNIVEKTPLEIELIIAELKIKTTLVAEYLDYHLRTFDK